MLSRHFRALEFPCGHTAHMEKVAVEVGRHSTASELDFDLGLVWRDQFAADRTGHAAARSTVCAVRRAARHPAAAKHCPSLLSQHRLVRHIYEAPSFARPA